MAICVAYVFVESAGEGFAFDVIYIAVELIRPPTVFHAADINLKLTEPLLDLPRRSWLDAFGECDVLAEDANAADDCADGP